MRKAFESLADILERRIVYIIQDMEAVEIKRDLRYGMPDVEHSLMDVYTPPHAGPDGPIPAILFIHGGPLRRDIPMMPKDWGVYVSYGELAAASGLVGITFNHRYYGYGDLGQAAEDVQLAIRYVRENAGYLNVDPDRLGLWAFSGGGPQLSFALREPPPYLRALASFYAVLDLRELESQQGLSVSPETLERFSPIAHLKPNSQPKLPLFIGRAGKDDPRLNAGVDAFVAQALSGDYPITVYNHPQGRHAFDVLDDDDRSREIIAAALEFFRWHLLGSRSDRPVRGR